MTIIRDGTGSGAALKITEDNRSTALVRAFPLQSAVSKSGESFNANTVAIALTAATESGVYYLRNNDARTIVLSTLFFHSMLSTGGAAGQVGLVTVTRNPTAGTLISAGVAVPVTNRNFDSAKTIDVTFLVGVEGSTVTDGEFFFTAVHGPTGRSVFPVDLYLPQGSSIAIRYTPPAGNTAQTIYVGVSFFIADEEV